MIKAKHQRLVLLAIAVVVVTAAALIAAWALKSKASYFYVPSEIVAAAPDPDTGVRLGGMVEKGSIKTGADGITINFMVGDGKAQVPVKFAGIVPSLFVEGSGVVAEGRMGADGVFVADNLLAKHDKNYVPRELEGVPEEHAKTVVADAK